MSVYSASAFSLNTNTNTILESAFYPCEIVSEVGSKQHDDEFLRSAEILRGREISVHRLELSSLFTRGISKERERA